MDLTAAERPTVSRQQAVRIEGPCDFAIHLSRDDEIANPCFKSRDVGVIAVAAHIAPDLVLADGTSLPDDSDPDLAALGPLIEDDLFHDEPKDLLALDHARRIPQFGKILTQRDNLSRSAAASDIG